MFLKIYSSETSFRDYFKLVLIRLSWMGNTFVECFDFTTNLPGISWQIVAYNSTGAEALEQVQESVKRLNSITEEINQTKSILSQEFYDNVRDNDQKLEELTKVT